VLKTKIKSTLKHLYIELMLVNNLDYI